MIESYEFQLSFKGELIDNSVDAYDVANTILATSQSLNQISILKYGQSATDHLKINIQAFNKGSLISNFLIYLNDEKAPILALLPALKGGFGYCKDILSIYKTYIDVKVGLKGKPPQKVIANDGAVVIYGDNNFVMNVNPSEFRALQDKLLSKTIAKAISPLTREGSFLTSLAIIEDQEETVIITKEVAPYLESQEQFQTVEMVKYKGVVSKIDTKACSGFLSLGAHRRLPFNFSEASIPQEKFLILIESLKNRIQIYLIGDVTMDYEGNPKNMILKDVHEDKNLFI